MCLAWRAEKIRRRRQGAAATTGGGIGTLLLREGRRSDGLSWETGDPFTAGGAGERVEILRATGAQHACGEGERAGHGRLFDGRGRIAQWHGVGGRLFNGRSRIAHPPRLPHNVLLLLARWGWALEFNRVVEGL